MPLRSLLPSYFQRLFWKIFFTIWLVSAAGMMVVLLLLLNRSAESYWHSALQAQLSERATAVVARYEAQGQLFPHDLKSLLKIKPWRRETRHLEEEHAIDEESEHPVSFRRDRPAPPIWIEQISAAGVTRIVSPSMPIPENSFQFEVRSTSGQLYRFYVALPPELKHRSEWISHVFSIQMLLILIIAGLSALLLSFLIVRPIKRLRRHVQQIYHEQNFSSRADVALSQRQDELGELTREFDLMASYVERTLLDQQRLLQDVSHEFRAPLARLQTCAGLAEQQLGEGHYLVERIDRECQRLDRLISEVLSFSRLDSLPDQRAWFDVKTLFDELLLDLTFSQPERPIQLHLLPEKIQVFSNRDLLTRALRNGLENALKYTDANSLIELSAYEREQTLTIVLRDHGPGIDETLLDHICTPFVRGHSEQWQGYGLGMSIAQRAMQRLQGRLLVDNHPEGGLQLTYELKKTQPLK